MQDKSDDSIIHTALREAEEEIGLKIKKCDIWGTLGGCITQVPMSIYIIIGY